MGYRSSVYFSVPNESYEDFRKDLAERAAEDGVNLAEVDKFLDDLRQQQFPDRHIYFHDYIKWYTEDPVINLVQEVVTGLEEATFIRYGEDSEDVDFWSNEMESQWIRWGAVSCVGSKDALSAACCFLDGMERALPAVRQEAITKLTEILQKLQEAEGLGELEDDGSFEEAE